jgi:hypothetical protein
VQRAWNPSVLGRFPMPVRVIELHLRPGVGARSLTTAALRPGEARTLSLLPRWFRRRRPVGPRPTTSTTTSSPAT